MGHDMAHQAVPAEADWWARIWADREVRSDIASLPYDFIWIQSGRPFPFPDATISVEAANLMTLRPGIETRNADLMRGWDQLHYLLSKPRRAAPHGPGNFKDAEDIGTVAIRGQKRLNQDLTGGQGYQVRYTDAEAALDVAAFLDSMTEADLRAHYDPPRMCLAGVYKMSRDDGETRFQYLLGYFHNLRRLYAEAVEYEEGILVCIV